MTPRLSPGCFRLLQWEAAMMLDAPMLLDAIICFVLILQAAQPTAGAMTSHVRCKQNYMYDIWR